MFKNTFQSGFLSILYSIGSKPLQIWDKKVKNGHIKRVTDNDIHSNVLEVEGANVSTTYITCPADPKKTLGIKLPFLVMIIKNLKKYFTFEIQVLDDKNVRRRFRASNYQSTTRVKPFICTMPMRLDDGWNQIQFNLSDFTRRAYGTNYTETLRVQIHANCRIRRVYFSDRLYSEDELPAEFKLYLPVQSQKAKVRTHCACSNSGSVFSLWQTLMTFLVVSYSNRPPLAVLSHQRLLGVQKEELNLYRCNMKFKPFFFLLCSRCKF
uniref:Cilia- and flagella-associated protein 20 n=1 Tax=Salarias fasciatus TaxID=181472 RepID=A0A672IUT7_SALFA